MAETTFVRSKKQRDYTTMDNTFLRDDTLSAAAKGVFAYLLFLPDDWTIYQSELCKHFSNGKDSLRKIINELEEHGYIIKEKVKGEKGRFGGYRYIIIEQPCLKDRDGKSATESPTSENPPLPNTNNNQILNKSNTNKPTEKPSFSKTDYDECRKLIESSRAYLIQKGMQIDTTLYPIPTLNKWIKKSFELYGIEQTKTGIKQSVNNQWLVSTAHYSLSAMFSEKIFPKLLSENISTNQIVKGQSYFNDNVVRDYSHDEGRF